MFRSVRAHAFVLLRLRAMARVKSSTAMERYVIIITTIVVVMTIATTMTIITSRWCYKYYSNYHNQVVLQTIMTIITTRWFYKEQT